MELTIEIIVFAVVVLMLNVADSVTTELAFRQYPDKELKGEANTFMRHLMLKSRALAEVVKHGMMLAIVGVCLWRGDMWCLHMGTIMLGLAVVNNTSIVVSRAITKRKVESPIRRLMEWLHIPENYIWLVVMMILVGLAIALNKCIWG